MTCMFLVFKLWWWHLLLNYDEDMTYEMRTFLMSCQDSSYILRKRWPSFLLNCDEKHFLNNSNEAFPFCGKLYVTWLNGDYLMWTALDWEQFIVNGEWCQFLRAQQWWEDFLLFSRIILRSLRPFRQSVALCGLTTQPSQRHAFLTWRFSLRHTSTKVYCIKLLTVLLFALLKFKRRDHPWNTIVLCYCFALMCFKINSVLA